MTAQTQGVDPGVIGTTPRTRLLLAALLDHQRATLALHGIAPTDHDLDDMCCALFADAVRQRATEILGGDRAEHIGG